MAVNDELIKVLHHLLEIFLTHRVENGYCYFTLRSILGNKELNADEKIEQISS